MFGRSREYLFIVKFAARLSRVAFQAVEQSENMACYQSATTDENSAVRGAFPA